MTLHEQMHGLFKIGVVSSYKPLSPKIPAACQAGSGWITKLSVCGTVHCKEMLCYKINESFQEVDDNELITNSWHVHMGLEGDETSTSSARGKHNTALLLIHQFTLKVCGSDFKWAQYKRTSAFICSDVCLKEEIKKYPNRWNSPKTPPKYFICQSHVIDW